MTISAFFIGAPDRGVDTCRLQAQPLQRACQYMGVDRLLG